MRFVFFCHAVAADWNNGNAHFLRGVLRALAAMGHDCRVHTPANGWSLTNQLREPGGREALARFHAVFPEIREHPYPPGGPDLDVALDGADAVLVHEWNPPELVAAVGRTRLRGGRFLLFFHDTHHRSVSEPDWGRTRDLTGYDGVLAFGEVIRRRYLDQGWAADAWTWHEAADVEVFRPPAEAGEMSGGGEEQADLVWIGNWGDEERSRELADYLLTPARRLGLAADVYGVRYPRAARQRLARAGFCYRGWLPNLEAPRVYARHRVTLHVPRRQYVRLLPGIPTIRVFEALACGIPLLCAPWDDAEGLFSGSRDYLQARRPEQVEGLLRSLLHEPELARSLAAHGLHTILSRHTCAHRAAELLALCGRLGRSAANDLEATG